MPSLPLRKSTTLAPMFQYKLLGFLGSQLFLPDKPKCSFLDFGHILLAVFTERFSMALVSLRIFLVGCVDGLAFGPFLVFEIEELLIDEITHFGHAAPALQFQDSSRLLKAK